MKRSADGGQTWTNLTIIQTNAGNPTAVWDAINHQVLLQCNHGGISQLMSADGGRTWSPAVNVSKLLRNGTFPALLVPGPGTGLQLSPSNPQAPNRILFIGHIGYSLAYVWYSDDGGASYTLSNTSNLTFMNEAQIAEMPDGRVMANMRNHHHNATCKCRGIAASSDAGASFGAVYYDPQLVSPICMATILRGSLQGSAKNAVFFANPANPNRRINGTIRRSDDNGQTWSKVLTVVETNWSQPYDYSSLTLTSDPETLGLLWETWEPIGGKHCNGEACSIVFSRFPVTL